jgi:uncharacterized protein (TIGR00106 family)
MFEYQENVWILIVNPLRLLSVNKKLQIVTKNYFLVRANFVEKINRVIADFSIVPIGEGKTSVGRYVAAAVKAFKSIEGLNYEVTAMGTVLSAKDLDTIFAAVKQAHEAVMAKGVKRVESTLRIDDRRDKPRTMDDKVLAVKEYIKQA